MTEIEALKAWPKVNNRDAARTDMLLLTVGLALFIAVHLIPTNPDLRRSLVTRYGEAAYKGAYSVFALAGLVLMLVAWGKAKRVGIWTPPSWGRHAAMVLMLPVFPLLSMAFHPGRINAVVRHPMITAVKLWALAHLFVRGDSASLILFLGLLGWAVYDRISLKSREARGLVTIETGPLANDIISIVVGLVLYGAFVHTGHRWLIGVPLM